MIDNTLARRLHDKVTRGGTLTEAERTALEAWYEQEDHKEGLLLGSSTSAASPTLDTLREQLAAALARLREETQRIQVQADENEALRREIAVLSERLVYVGSRQPKQGAAFAPHL